MLENTKPIPRDLRGDESLDEFGDELLVGSVDSPPQRGTDGGRAREALRAIEWSELVARLNAARDLRRELRHDSLLCGGSSGASFGDAAASFFKSMGNGAAENSERAANHEPSEGCKASCDNTVDTSGDATKGDARKET